MFKRILKHNYIFLILIIFAAFWQGRFLFLPGLHTFSDESHIANLHQMIAALQSGQFPPRWAPNFSYNFGHPFFNFYYLLPYLVGAIFNIFFGLSLIWSLKLVFLISLIASGISMYYLSLKFFNKTTSFSVSLIYLFTPYRAVDLYVRGAIGELFGFIFMPLVLLAFINLTKTKKSVSLILSVISLFLLIISHNLTILIFFPLLILFLAIYLFQNIPQKDRLNSAIRSVMAIGLSLLLSSFYLIPALFEKKYMQTGTPFNPADHFPFIKQLLIPYWGYGASVWGPTDELSFQIGVSNLLAILILLFLIIFSRIKFKPLITGLIGAFFLSVFMMNIRSLPLWQLIPISSYIQFPWRFLILTTFISSFSAGFISLVKKPYINKIPIILAIISILFTFPYFKPHKIQNVDDNYYLNRFFINQNSQNDPGLLSNVYHFNSEDYLPLTIWTSKRPSSLPPKIELPPQAIISDYKTPTSISYQFKIYSPKNSEIKINNYYFPGWQASIDGRAAEIHPSDKEGRIGLYIPQGQHDISLKFTDTPVRKISNIISLVTLACLSLYLIKPKSSSA